MNQYLSIYLSNHSAFKYGDHYLVNDLRQMLLYAADKIRYYFESEGIMEYALEIGNTQLSQETNGEINIVGLLLKGITNEELDDLISYLENENLRVYFKNEFEWQKPLFVTR